MHRNLKTIPEVNMNYLSSAAFEKQIGRMTIAESKDVANHTVHGKGAGIGGTAFQPMLRTRTFKPEDSVQVLASGVFQRIFEYFHLLEECQVLVVRCHL